MKNYSTYLVTKRFKEKGLCGEVNLPFGTKCFVERDVICCDAGMICYIASQNAFDYFTQNDDGLAVERRNLINGIMDSLLRTNQDIRTYDEKWDKVWNDDTCLKYRRKDCGEHWLWSYDFYNAEISDLQYIAKLVCMKGVK